MTKTMRRTHEDEPTAQQVEERAKLEALYAGTFKNLTEGSVIEGVVLSVQRDGVIVDIGYKSAGVIPKGEFSSEALANLAPGSKLLVYLEDQEDVNGNVVLSKEKADRMHIWGDIEAIHKNETHVEGTVLSKIRGGLIVDIGVKAFLPGSQIDLKPVRDMDSLIGKTFPMKIIKMDHRRGNIIVSRRSVLEESRDSRRKKTLLALKEGQVIEGGIKNITEYGAFVDLGGIDGLLHITDMSWGRVGHPSEIFSVGQKISVVVLKYDKDTGRISLGYKQQHPDPWNNIEAKYALGNRLVGKVAGLTDYGAFVELEPGIEGLVHISDMTWSHETRHPSRIVSVGDQVNVIVLNLDRKSRKVSLGMKQIESNPWETIAARYPVGTKISGKVRSVTEFGVFVGMEDGIDGLVHISDISASRHVKHPSELFKKGQMVEAVVLKVDCEKERVSLGCKQLVADLWEREILPNYPVGSYVKGKVTRMTHFGLFVALAENAEGLVHASETGVRHGARVDEVFSVGDVVEAKVVRVDPGEQKISLSIRAFMKETDAAAIEHYQARQTPSDAPAASEAVPSPSPSPAAPPPEDPGAATANMGVHDPEIG